MSWAACSFSFLGDVAFIHMEEEALKGHGGLVAWEKRSSKTLHVQRDRDPGNSEGRMAVLSHFFLKGGSGELGLVFLVKLLSIMCFWQDHLFWCNVVLLQAAISACYFPYLFFGLWHLCACVQYTLRSSLLFHVYHTSFILVSTLPHNLLEGQIFGIWEEC